MNELFFKSVIFHPLLEPAAGLERSSRFPFSEVFENSGKLQSALLLLPQFDEIFKIIYDSPYWSTVSVSQWMELFFTSVFVHPLLEPAAGLERDVQVAREELTQNTFWGPRAQIVLKLVASWPDKWCHIIMLVTYKSGLNGHYVSPRLCSMARNFHIPMAVSITTKSKMGNDASRKKNEPDQYHV